MADGSEGPYSHRQLNWALIISALIGWVGVTAMSLAGFELDKVLFLLPFAIVIGLPIAFLLTFLVGGPVLRRATQRPLTWLRAASGGAYVATIVAGISILIGRLYGLTESLDSSRYSRIGGGDYIQSIDGILTLYGWYMLGLRTAVFIVFGAGIGLVVRLVIGAGRPMVDD